MRGVSKNRKGLLSSLRCEGSVADASARLYRWEIIHNESYDYVAPLDPLNFVRFDRRYDDLYARIAPPTLFFRVVTEECTKPLRHPCLR